MTDYRVMFRGFLSERTETLRKSRDLKQWEMAEKLRISDRAYSDLARGKYCFSTVALLFLLLAMEEEERKSFFNELDALVHRFENREAG